MRRTPLRWQNFFEIIKPQFENSGQIAPEFADEKPICQDDGRVLNGAHVLF